MHVASFSSDTCVYKVMGAPAGAAASTSTTSSTSAPRRSRCSATTATRPTPGRRSCASSRSRCSATTARSTRSRSLREEARMLGVPIHADGSDSQDLNRTSTRSSTARGMSLAEAMELVLPPIVNEISSFPEELRGFYMYLRQALGPFAQGPIALVARHGDECVFSVDALGLRPLWQVETPTPTSSPPSRASCRSPRGRREPKPLAPGEKVLVRIKPGQEGRGCYDHQQMQRLVHERWLAAHRRRAVAGYEQAIPTGGPLEGPEIPGYAAAGPAEPVKVEDRVLGRLRLAARGHEARPADGLQRRRADRLARLRRAAGRALARAPEPGRLLQGDGRRRHQPGDRPRARDRALLLPRRVRRAARRLERRRRRAAHGRDRLPDHPRRPRRAWRRCRTRSTARSRRSTRPTCSRTSGSASAGTAARARHLAARVGDHPGRDRAAQARGREDGARRRRAARALRPHRLRGRPPLHRPAPRARRRSTARCASTGSQPDEENLRRRTSIVLRSGAIRNVHDVVHGPRPRRRRRLPLRDDRGRSASTTTRPTSTTSARRCARASRR